MVRDNGTSTYKTMDPKKSSFLWTLKVTESKKKHLTFLSSLTIKKHYMRLFTSVKQPIIFNPTNAKIEYPP